jgi:UDP-N-acetyl-D-glucosamine dehydrogenase
VDPARVEMLNHGESYIADVSSETLRPFVDDGRIAATTDYDELRDADAILVALPTPLSRQREPDLSILVSAAKEISKRLQPGQLVVLESTTYPGTTREQVQPALEAGSGLRAGQDFHLAFSPERVDPGREDWTTKNVTKVVGGVDEGSTAAAVALYSCAIDDVHAVSSPEAAELTKLLENIFRSVNIALVNELAQLCDRMHIDVWEVIDAARPSRSASCRSSRGPASAALHPDRPLLPHLEGARVRLTPSSYRARRKGQRVDAVLLPIRRLAGSRTTRDSGR